MKKNLYTAAFVGFMFLFTLACGSGSSADVTLLTPEQFAEAMATDSMAMVIDVRTPEEYAQGHISGAQLMNVSEEGAFRSAVDTLDEAHTYYIYCRSGRRSRKAAAIMQERGLRVVDMKGGYNAWQGRDSMDVSVDAE